MELRRAKKLVKDLDRALPSNGLYTLAGKNVDDTLNGCKHIKGYLIENPSGILYWVHVVEWRPESSGDYYVVIKSESQAKIAELHDVNKATSTPSSTDLRWYYVPKRDAETNPKRIEAFVKMAGTRELIVSLPSDVVSVVDFLDDLFALAGMREAADQVKVVNIMPPSFPEGKRVEKIHRYLERNSQVVRDAKKQHAKNGRLPCQACGLDFEETYGSIGQKFIEAHHKVPLSELAANEIRQTTVEDFDLVCSNCHRMMHRSNPCLGIDEIREALGNS